MRRHADDGKLLTTGGYLPLGDDKAAFTLRVWEESSGEVATRNVGGGDAGRRRPAAPEGAAAGAATGAAGG